MPIYMQFEGIKGQVTAEGFKDQVQLDSFQLGVGRSVALSSGHGSNRETSSPSVSEIMVTKQQDAASIALLNASLFGEGKKCVISFTKTSADGKADQTYYVITLENTLVSGYSVSGTSEGRPSESISLNYTRIEAKYIETDAKNKAEKPAIATWDLAAGKK